MDLSGSSVLLVEDEVLIAELYAELVEEAGGQVVGPALSNREASELLKSQTVTCALLDINLRDGEVVPTAMELKRRGIPFVVSSGCALPARLRAVFGDAPVLHKPARPTEVIRALEGMALRRLRLHRDALLRERVLVIEDEADTAAILAAHLQALGFRSVDHAATESEAIRQAEQHRPDFMVVDLRLRDGNGLSAATTIRQRHGTPMIVVTAYPPEAGELDPRLVVQKPFNAASLKSAVVHAAFSATAI